MLYKSSLDLHAARFLSRMKPVDKPEIEGKIEDDIRFISDAFRFYLAKGYIPTSTQLELISRYCSSGGLSYQRFSELLGIRLFDGSISSALASRSDIQSRFSSQEICRIVEQLATDGYTNTYDIFTRDFCQKLLHSIHAMKASCLSQDGLYTEITGAVALQQMNQYVLVNIGIRELLRSPLYVEALLLANAMTDVLLYLTPYHLRLVSGRLCLSYATIHSQHEEAAQSWHFDLDGIGFVKQFIYLNDVDESNGAHMYIPGTHKPGCKAHSLLSRGYSRISDADMFLMQRQQPVTVGGKAGSSFLGSTLCWHKGGHVSIGHRAILILEYSVSKFQLKVI